MSLPCFIWNDCILPDTTQSYYEKVVFPVDKHWISCAKQEFGNENNIAVYFVICFHLTVDLIWFDSFSKLGYFSDQFMAVSTNIRRYVVPFKLLFIK